GGFPEALTLYGELKRVRKVLTRWAAAAPLAALHLSGASPGDWRAIDGPHLRGVRHLSLLSAAGTGLKAAAASPHLGQLESLSLEPVRADESQSAQALYRALSASALAERLRRLSLSFADGTEGRAFRKAQLRTLTALSTRGVLQGGEAGAAVADLLAVPNCGGVEELALDSKTSHALGVTDPAALGRLQKL